jgi:hypothetical protein
MDVATGPARAPRRFRPRLGRARPLLLVVLPLLALVATLASPPRPAGATFHIARISEAMFGVNGDPNVQYVEINMLTIAQGQVGHTRLSAWNADGSFFGVLLEVPSGVTNSNTNVKWIMATPGFAAASGITPDFTFAPATLPSTGMICWGAPGVSAPNPPTRTASDPLNYVDCIPYGGYAAGNVRFASATPFGLGNGTQSLTRVSSTNDTSVDMDLECPTPQANSGAVGFNRDANFISNHPTYAVDDKTRVNSDTVGDGCGDSDDDNDGIPDGTETNLASLQSVCPAATATTDPFKLDTDGDRVTDGAECALGSDPANAASKPAPPAPGTDSDADGLSNTFEAAIGTNPNAKDTDGDGLQDGWEYKGHGSNPLVVDTDGDGVTDGCEVASLNGDTVVNAGDQSLLAAENGRAVPVAAKLTNFDLNKDGAFNAGDLAIQASRVGGAPVKCPLVSPWPPA